MMLIAIIVLMVACLGLIITASHLYDERNIARIMRDAARETSDRLYDQIHATENAAPDIPSPAQDSFLELADLRRQLVERTQERAEMTLAYGRALDVITAANRTNAALRGQITKLTKPKASSKR